MTPRPRTAARPRSLLAGLSLGLLLSASLAQAAPDERREGATSDRRSERGSERSSERANERGRERGNGRGAERMAEGQRSSPPAPVQASSRRGEPQRWFDGAHGHNHHYPRPGWAVRTLPPRASLTFWGGVRYSYFDGIWYTGAPHGYVVVRPPIGIVISERPALASVLVIGGLSYLYANGVYYREQPDVGYEVVPPPVQGEIESAPARSYVYPRQAQSAEQQATDDYECHKWAVTQTGFDPTGAATGQTTGATPARRSDYERARGACLEGRGYTVR